MCSRRLGGAVGTVGAALGALLAALPAAFPSPAWAQACCTTTGSTDLAVVGRCHRAVVGAQLGFEHGVGSYDADGSFHPYGDAVRVEDATFTLGAGSRIGIRTLQLDATLPLRLQYRAYSGVDDHLAAGLGDVAASLRWTALEDDLGGLRPGEPRSRVPFLDLYLTVKAPTGRAPDASRDPTGADVTGDGTWEGVAGARVAKFLVPKESLRLAVTWGEELPHAVDGGDTSSMYRRGGELDANLSWLHIHGWRLSYGAFVDARITTAATLDGEPVADSGRERARVGAMLVHVAQIPWWEVNASLSVDALWSGGGRNLPTVGPSAAVGVRRNF